MAEIKVKYKKDTPELKVLKQGDWIDLAVPSEVKLSAGEFKVIDLGLAMSLPEGTEAHIVPRSSTFKKWGIILANQIGIIDNSYSGDNDYWQAQLYALRDTTIPRGTRILQFRIVPTMMSTYPNLRITKVDKLQGPNRGGLGSTGN